MDVDTNFQRNPYGKVLLYTSRDVDASPVMSIKHQTTSNLPSILNTLGQKFSPLRRKYLLVY